MHAIPVMKTVYWNPCVLLYRVAVRWKMHMTRGKKSIYNKEIDLLHITKNEQMIYKYYYNFSSNEECALIKRDSSGFCGSWTHEQPANELVMQNNPR